MKKIRRMEKGGDEMKIKGGAKEKKKCIYIEKKQNTSTLKGIILGNTRIINLQSLQPLPSTINKPSWPRPPI